MPRFILKQERLHASGGTGTEAVRLPNGGRFVTEEMPIFERACTRQVKIFLKFSPASKTNGFDWAKLKHLNPHKPNVVDVQVLLVIDCESNGKRIASMDRSRQRPAVPSQIDQLHAIRSAR